MQDLILKRNPKNLLMQQYKSIFGGDSYRDSQLPDNAKEVSYLANKFKTTNQFFELEANYRKELADMYLLATIISKQFGEDFLVKTYFRKAREYEPRYIRYLKDIEKIYSIDELMQDAKIALVEEEYSEAKFIFRSLLYLNVTDEQYVYIYEKLFEIAKIQDNRDGIIEACETLLFLYSKNNLRQSEIYYELSHVYKTRTKKIKSLENGKDIVDGEYSNEFLEIKYKILKRYNKLQGEKNIYLNLKPLLEKLSNVNPKYRDDYNELLLRDRYWLDWKNLTKNIDKQLKWVWSILGMGSLIAYGFYMIMR